MMGFSSHLCCKVLSLVQSKFLCLKPVPTTPLKVSIPPSLPSAAVSSCVHALLGGGVDHRGTDAWDLADDAKLLQRLYALNVLRLEGHDPDVALWTVRQSPSTH